MLPTHSEAVTGTLKRTDQQRAAICSSSRGGGLGAGGGVRGQRLQ